jgi:hypothetical protein
MPQEAPVRAFAAVRGPRRRGLRLPLPQRPQHGLLSLGFLPQRHDAREQEDVAVPDEVRLGDDRGQGQRREESRLGAVPVDGAAGLQT